MRPDGINDKAKHLGQGVGTNTQKAWGALRAWMDREGMAGDLMDGKYNNRFILRGENFSHIEGLIEAWTLTWTSTRVAVQGKCPFKWPA